MKNSSSLLFVIDKVLTEANDYYKNDPAKSLAIVEQFLSRKIDICNDSARALVIKLYASEIQLKVEINQSFSIQYYLSLLSRVNTILNEVEGCGYVKDVASNYVLALKSNEFYFFDENSQHEICDFLAKEIINQDYTGKGKYGYLVTCFLDAMQNVATAKTKHYKFHDLITLHAIDRYVVCRNYKRAGREAKGFPRLNNLLVTLPCAFWLTKDLINTSNNNHWHHLGKYFGLSQSEFRWFDRKSFNKYNYHFEKAYISNYLYSKSIDSILNFETNNLPNREFSFDTSYKYFVSRLLIEPQPFLPNRSLSPNQLEQYAAYYSAVVGKARHRYRQRWKGLLSDTVTFQQARHAHEHAQSNLLSFECSHQNWLVQLWYKIKHTQDNLHNAVTAKHQQMEVALSAILSSQDWESLVTQRVLTVMLEVVDVHAPINNNVVTLLSLTEQYLGNEKLITLLRSDSEDDTSPVLSTDEELQTWANTLVERVSQLDFDDIEGEQTLVEKHRVLSRYKEAANTLGEKRAETFETLKADIQTATLQARLLNTVRARLKSDAFAAIHTEAMGCSIDDMFNIWQDYELSDTLTNQLDSLLGKLQPSPILSLRSDYRDETMLEPASVEEVWHVMCHPASVRDGIQAHIKQWLEVYFEPLTWPQLTTIDKAMSVRWLVLDVLLSTLLKQQVLHMPVDELKWLERRIPQWHMRWLRDKVYRPWAQEKIKDQEAISTLWHLFNYQTLPLDGLYAKPIDLHKNPTFEQACDVTKQLLASEHCVTRDIEGGEVDQWPIMDIWMSAFTGRRDEYNLKCLDAFIRDKHKLPDNVEVQSYLPAFLQTGSTGLLDPIPTIAEVGNTLKPGQMMLLGVFTPQPDVSGPGVKYTEHTQHLHALCLTKPNGKVIPHYVELTTPDTCPNPDWHAELKGFWEAGNNIKSLAPRLDSPPPIIQVVLSQLTELAKGLNTQNGPGELFVLWPAQVPLQWQELTHQGSLNLLPWEYWLQQQNDCKVRWHRMVSIAHYMERKKTPPENKDAPTQQDTTSSEPSWHFSGEQQLNDLHYAHLAVWPYDAHIEDKHNNTLLDLVACLAKPADGVFIGHGSYNSQTPSQSHLSLDRGGQLPAWMLPALTINTRNLNLTVCETATNANHHMAISNLFLRAGVQSTIATLWQVPVLSNLLYNLLLKQSAKSEPITRAHMWTAKKHLSQLTKDEAEALIKTLPDTNSIKEALTALNLHCTKELVFQAPIHEGKPLFSHPLYHAPYVWGE